jgi:hypothetical protein
MIEFECSKCGYRLDVAADYSGKRVRCKRCGQIEIVPASQPQTGSTTGNATDTPEEFMEQNFDVFQALLKHEKEAPAVELPRSR